MAMKVDTAGNVWATGPGGVYIFARERRSMLGHHPAPAVPTAESLRGATTEHALHHGEHRGVAGQDEGEGKMPG